MNKTWLKWPVFVLLCFIWGSSFILMKASREGLSGVQIGGLRIFSAAVVCLPIAWMQRRHFSGKQWRLLFLAGLCGNLLPAFFVCTRGNEDRQLPGGNFEFTNATDGALYRRLGVSRSYCRS